METQNTVTEIIEKITFCLGCTKEINGTVKPSDVHEVINLFLTGIPSVDQEILKELSHKISY